MENGYSESPLIEWIKSRLWEQNKNFLQATIGETGNGKSYCSLRMAECIDPNFNIDKVVFDPVKFLKKLEDREFRQGDCIVYDEAGTSVSAKTWMTTQNRMMGAVMETFRAENLSVIFTVPNLDSIDKHLRRLLHAYLLCKHVHKKDEVVETDWKRLEYNAALRKWYTKSLYDANGGVVARPVFPVYINKPTNSIIQQYEDKKAQFLQKTYSKSREIVENIVSGNSDKQSQKAEPKNKRILAMHEEGMEDKDIAAEVGTQVQYVRNTISQNK